MRISRVIAQLENYKRQHGDIDVMMEHNTDYFNPEEFDQMISEISFRIEDYPEAPVPFKFLIVQGG